jgi:MFS family permease
MLGSAHFLGFFIGCWWAPRLMGSVGHSRAFAAFTAAGSIGLMAHMMVVDPYAWGLMRVASGMCVAGCYTVIEAWMQAKVTNETRGRTMGVYRVVDMSGSLAAQLIVGVLAPASYVSYNLLAIGCCAALLPLTLTKVRPPETPSQPRLRPRLAFDRSPLAAAGVIVAAVSSASFRMVGPIYGQEVGLSAPQIAWFLAAFVLGGALAQYPMGMLADKFDRRWVLIWLSVAAMGGCAVTVMGAGHRRALPRLGPDRQFRRRGALCDDRGGPRRARAFWPRPDARPAHSGRADALCLCAPDQLSHRAAPGPRAGPRLTGPVFCWNWRSPCDKAAPSTGIFI